MMDKTVAINKILMNLKAHNVNVKDYDYIEGTTTEEYMQEHRFIMHGRRFYDNPFVWTLLIEGGRNDLIGSILNITDYNPDVSIVRACVTASRKCKYTIGIIDRVLSRSEDKEADLDQILCDIAEAGKVKLFKDVVDLANTLEINPKFGTYGNTGNGTALLLATGQDSDEMADYLLSIGAKPTEKGSLAFAKACRSAHYKLAVKMMDKGADIHAKGNLGLRMIQRNDKNHIIKDEEFRKVLLEKYKLDEIEAKNKE